MPNTTYATVGHAVNDPNSNLARFMKQGAQTMTRNERVIQQWMATGLTREQAWTEALKTRR